MKMMKRRQKRRGDRYDATRVPMPPNLNSIMPYLMKGRNESVVYIPMNIDAENLLAYVAERKGTPEAVSLFEVIMLALTAVLRERPRMNRYIIGRRLYQRRDVVLSFISKRDMSDDGEETNVMVTIRPDDDRATILAKLRGEIKVAKKGQETKDDDKLVELFLKLPRSLLRLAVWVLEMIDFYHDAPGILRGIDPLRASAYVANLGSVGIDAPYHHLFEWGTCSIFMAIGKVAPQVCVGEDGRPDVRRHLPLRFSFDERTSDGYYDARSMELFMGFLADPAKLETR